MVVIVYGSNVELRTDIPVVSFLSLGMSVILHSACTMFCKLICLSQPIELSPYLTVNIDAQVGD